MEKGMDKAAQILRSIPPGQWARDLDLRSSALACADLESTMAERVNLSQADLHGANLGGSHWVSSSFQEATCQESNWTVATLRCCEFERARAAGARFDGARLEDSSAEGADFSRANFSGAHLTETSFSRAVMREAILNDAEGDGVEFRGADLRGASLKGARFDEADFRGADLRGADLSLGRFHSADFRGALLEGARFEGADCSGASFDRGEGPSAGRADDTGAPPSPKTDPVAGILGEFLSALPEAMSGTQPAETMARVEALVNRLAASAGYSPQQQQMFRDYLADVTKPGGFNVERFKQLLAALDSESDEPPEEFREWLEPLMKLARDRQP